MQRVQEAICGESGKYRFSSVLERGLRGKVGARRRAGTYHLLCRCPDWWMPPPPLCWQLCPHGWAKSGCLLGTWGVNRDSGATLRRLRCSHRFLVPPALGLCPLIQGMLGGSGHQQARDSPGPTRPGTRGLRHSSRHSQPHRRREA